MSRRVVVVFLVLSLPASLLSQQAPQYTEQVEVRIRNLDVVVTDRAGKTVRGLKKSDFVVLENGVEQNVSNFAFYDSGATVAESFDTNNPKEEEIEPAPPRRFMFFIDEMAMQPRARASLKKHVNDVVSTMRPGDLATVVRPTGSKKIVQDYTGDLAAIQKSLNAAIDSCRISLTSPQFAEFRKFRRDLEQASTPRETSLAKREYAQRETDRVQHRLAQIRALLATMSREEGKKVFVMVTSGLSSQPGRAAYEFDQEMKLFETGDWIGENKKQTQDETWAEERDAGWMKAAARAGERRWSPMDRWQGMDRLEFVDFRSQIDDIARAAAADGVTIYALEPEVPLLLDTTTKGVDARSVGTSLTQNDVTIQKVVPQDMLNQLLHYEAETLTSLTEKTGGKWFRGQGEIDDVFRQLADDLRTYYSLAYRPPAGDDGKPRKIAVQVRNRPELKVRTRTEVVDEPESRDMADRVVAGLLVPYVENDLKMTVKADAPKKEGKEYEVPIEIVIPVERLKFFRAEDGTWRASVRVHYAAAREEKELLSYGQTEQMVELSEGQYAQRNRGRYRYASSIMVPKGNIKIALGVVDTSTRQASLQTLLVNAR
jgi:VWFA-related protein